MARRLILPLLIVAALIAAACTSSSTPSPSPASPEQPTIKIGIEGPMTGSQSVTGIDMFNAATLAVDEANANGGVAGAQIELVSLDDAAEVEMGKAVAAQAVADGVFAVVGPYNSSVGVENLDIYLENGIIPIHLTSSAETDGKGYTVQPKDYQVAPVEAEAITRWLKEDQVAVTYDPSEYTVGVANQLTKILKKDKANVVYDRKLRADLPVATVLKEINRTDAGLAYFSTYFPEGARFADAALNTMTADCFMGLANQDQEFIARAGIPASENCYFSGVPSPDQFPAAAGYVSEYQERFSLPPGTWGPFVHDSFTMLFAAADEAGSWNHDAIDEILKNTQGYEGLTGAIDIDPDTGNRPDVPIVILKVSEEGKFVIDPAWAKWADFPTS